MGQDKKQLTKLLAFVKEVYDNPDNKEFAAGIRSLLGSGDSKSTVDSEKIDEIYEFFWLTCKVPCLSYPKIL